MVTFWIVLGVVFSIIEILTPSFFFLWFGVGAFISAAVSPFLPITLQILIFGISSAILVLLTRPIAKKISGGEPPKKIHLDDIIGKEAIVIEKIDNIEGTGLVKIGGDVWRAYARRDDEKFEKGEKVRILKVEGAHVVVERVIE